MGKKGAAKARAVAVEQQTPAQFRDYVASQANDEVLASRWTQFVPHDIWKLSGVVDGLPQYRAALDGVLRAVRDMLEVEGSGGYLRPETLRSAATRHGIACAEQWDNLLRYLFAEGHLWPVDWYFVGPSPGPSSCAWRVRSLVRAPFDPGAPYPARLQPKPEAPRCMTWTATQAIEHLHFGASCGAAT